jgi:hypothetical protein
MHTIILCELVYDSRKLSGVITAISEVVGVLQMVSESNLAVSLVRTGQTKVCIKDYC